MFIVLGMYNFVSTSKVFFLCYEKPKSGKEPHRQRENRLRDSLGKFITLHKARAVYLGGRGRNKTLTRFSSWKFSMY